MKWEEDEIDFMRVALEEGWTHKDIANELSRTSEAISRKACRLKLGSLNYSKSHETYLIQVPNDISVLGKYLGARTKISHKHSCGFEWKVMPCAILSGHSCPKCGGTLKKAAEDYKKEVPKDIIVLEPYISYKTKILHKHLKCNFIWNASPCNILNGTGCPVCANSGFQPQKPAVTYCIYFPEHDLYKFGISNNHIQRLKQLGSTPEIIFIRKFELGSEARELEKQWSKNVDHLKINTGLLISGNTETFRI